MSKVTTNTLNTHLIKGIADKAKLEQLCSLARHNKVVNTIFTTKFFKMVEDRSIVLYRCVYCSKLYDPAHQDILQCSSPTNFNR